MYKYTLANFEIIGWKSWTCEESWEDHKDRNGDSSAHISVCYLYVLNLCGCKTTPVHALSKTVHVLRKNSIYEAVQNSDSDTDHL